jgi:hypothetical protein
MNGQGLEEIASILGREIDADKMYAILPNITGGNAREVIHLTQSERAVLAQYINIYMLFTNEHPQASEILQNLLMASIGGSSQIMAFELI